STASGLAGPVSSPGGRMQARGRSRCGVCGSTGVSRRSANTAHYVVNAVWARTDQSTASPPTVDLRAHSPRAADYSVGEIAVVLSRRGQRRSGPTHFGAPSHQEGTKGL